jgi:hypothetical protein
VPRSSLPSSIFRLKTLVIGSAPVIEIVSIELGVVIGALQSLYSNYEKYYQRWEENNLARARGLTPPVFIVVCNNTNVSKMVFDYIAGWEKTLKNRSTVLVPGKLALFSNVEGERPAGTPGLMRC